MYGRLVKNMSMSYREHFRLYFYFVMKGSPIVLMPDSVSEHIEYDMGGKMKYQCIMVPKNGCYACGKSL
jgi:hypothetical protein